MTRDKKGHYVNVATGFVSCRTCMKNDWKNYYATNKKGK